MWVCEEEEPAPSGRSAFRRVSWRGMAVVVALSFCCLSGPAGADNAGFVNVNGVRFELRGRPYYFTGANFWAGMNLGMPDATGGDRARLGRELDRLSGLGIRVVRVMAASEGPDTEPYRMAPALMTAPGVYNEDVFCGLDYLLAQLNAHDMRAVMVLNNYWHWSGGMAQYVAWSRATAIPYPNDTGDWNRFMDYAAEFYTNATCQVWFLAHVERVVGRTNSITGNSYSDDPTILAWELANEPRRYPPAWIDNVAAAIKAFDANHLVTTGSEGAAGTEAWRAGSEALAFSPTHDGPNIDFATCHIWPENWGWYDPENAAATYPVAISNAAVYLRTHLAEAAVLGKPLVLEEFGLARDHAAPLFDVFNPDAPTTYRDAFFASMFAEILASAFTDGPAGGDCCWAWGGEGRPGDPAPQWIGDPPHETPGWYSVYDADAATLAVISNHAAFMEALIPRAAKLNDYDADQRAELAVYHEARGDWYVRTRAGSVLLKNENWGFPGCIPVPADYDRNGEIDPAVYDTATGNWYAKTRQGRILIAGLNWGFPGCVPVPGDYDADGIADLAVYHPSSGNWYVRTSQGQTLALNWGFPGCVPVSGDFDADKRMELAVYHQDSGRWYIRTVAGQTLAAALNWGFTGAVPADGAACHVP